MVSILTGMVIAYLFIGVNSYLLPFTNI